MRPDEPLRLQSSSERQMKPRRPAHGVTGREGMRAINIRHTEKSPSSALADGIAAVPSIPHCSLPDVPRSSTVERLLERCPNRYLAFLPFPESACLHSRWLNAGTTLG
jgi:hypothetical protein